MLHLGRNDQDLCDLRVGMLLIVELNLPEEVGVDIVARLREVFADLHGAAIDFCAGPQLLQHHVNRTFVLHQNPQRMEDSHRWRFCFPVNETHSSYQIEVSGCELPSCLCGGLRAMGSAGADAGQHGMACRPISVRGGAGTAAGGLQNETQRIDAVVGLRIAIAILII